MKNLIKVLGVIFLVVAISSCQKPAEDLIIETPVTPTPHDSVTTLSKLIFIDTKVSATDTTGIIEYLYDTLKRVTTINHYDYDNGISTQGTVATYYYHGSDTLAYKKTEADPEPFGSLVTTFYSYDNMNRLIKDSAIAFGVEVNKYEYSDTEIDVNGYFYNPDLSDTSYFTTLSFLNGDAKVGASLTYPDEFGGVLDTFAYDNKPNPFNQLNIRTTFSPAPGYDFYLYDDYLLKNNVIVVFENHPLDESIVPTVIKFNYTYNSSGFPSVVDILVDDIPAEEPRIIFIYKKI